MWNRRLFSKRFWRFSPFPDPPIWLFFTSYDVSLTFFICTTCIIWVYRWFGVIFSFQIQNPNRFAFCTSLVESYIEFLNTIIVVASHTTHVKQVHGWIINQTKGRADKTHALTVLACGTQFNDSFQFVKPFDPTHKFKPFLVYFHNGKWRWKPLKGEGSTP